MDTIIDSDGVLLLMATCRDQSTQICFWKVVNSQYKPNFSCLPAWKNNEPIIAVPGDSNCLVCNVQMSYRINLFLGAEKYFLYFSLNFFVRICWFGYL